MDPLERIQLSPLRRLTDQLQHLVERHLWLQVLIGMVCGILVGLFIGPTVGWLEPSLSLTIASWLALPGTLFLALIQMIVVPLVFASIIRGLAASDNMEQLRKLGLGAGVFFILTTAAATAIGLGLGLIVQPGRWIDPELIRATIGSGDTAPSSVSDMPGFADLPGLLTSLLPTNPLASMVGGQMLQVILFAIVVGIALITLPPDKSSPLFDLLGSVQEVCMKIVSWAMRLAPIAVFGLVARLTAAVGINVLAGMAVYVLTVLAGLAMMAALLVGIAAFSGRRPLHFIRSITDVLLLAFSTSSSAAVMPLSIQTAEDRLHVQPSVARFLIPLGATINMNGTALYQGVATVFLAQVFDVPIGTWGLLFVVVMAVSASIGSPATPGTGIVILSMVLEGVGVPVAGIALIIGVDRILDMSRTAVNVTGDLTACVVLDRMGEKQAS